MSSSASQKQIAVSLYRRDPISTDPRKRKIFKHMSFHWAIMIIDGKRYEAYDATDKSYIDPTTQKMVNPAMGWWFQDRTNINPANSGMYLGHIVIGSVPSNFDAKTFLGQVPLPQKNKEPQQSCVTWVSNAISDLARAHHIGNFNIDEFMDWALDYADRRVKSPPTAEQIVHYLNTSAAAEGTMGKGKGKKKDDDTSRPGSRASSRPASRSSSRPASGDKGKAVKGKK